MRKLREYITFYKVTAPDQCYHVTKRPPCVVPWGLVHKRSDNQYWTGLARIAEAKSVAQRATLQNGEMNHSSFGLIGLPEAS